MIRLTLRHPRTQDAFADYTYDLAANQAVRQHIDLPPTVQHPDTSNPYSLLVDIENKTETVSGRTQDPDTAALTCGQRVCVTPTLYDLPAWRVLTYAAQHGTGLIRIAICPHIPDDLTFNLRFEGEL